MRCIPSLLIVVVAAAACHGKAAPAHDEHAAVAPTAAGPTPAVTDARVAGASATTAGDAQHARRQQPPPTAAQQAEYKRRMRAGWDRQKRQEWAQAVPEFEAALAAIADEPRALAELGWSAMNAGDFVKARAADELAVQVAVDRKVKAAALYNLGVVQSRAGDQAGTVRSWFASLALRPNKTVQEALAKLGARPEQEPAFCAPGARPCDCVVVHAFDELDPGTECTESKDPPPAPGFHVYHVGRDYTGWDYLLDEHDQLVAIIGGGAEHMHHMDDVSLDQIEVKTIGGHRVLWVQVSDDDDGQWPTDNDDVRTQSVKTTSVTLCVLGDATTPTRCPARDLPLSYSNRSEPPTPDDSQGTASITIADDGVASVKLVKGALPGFEGSLGPHRLW